MKLISIREMKTDTAWPVKVSLPVSPLKTPKYSEKSNNINGILTKQSISK